MSLLVICKILRLFVNTLTEDDKFFLCNSENLLQPIKVQLSEKQKPFSQLFAPFLRSTSNLKKIRASQLILLRHYRLPKSWLDQCLNSLLTQHHSTVILLRISTHLRNLHDSTCIILSYSCSLWGKLGLKMSLFVICKIFRLFVNTLTPNDKYFLCNSENLL